MKDFAAFRAKLSTEYKCERPCYNTKNMVFTSKSQNGSGNISWKENKASSKVKKFILLNGHTENSQEIDPKTDEKTPNANEIISSSSQVCESEVTDTKCMAILDKPAKVGKQRQLNNGRKFSNISFQSIETAEINSSDIVVKVDGVDKQREALGIDTKEVNDIDGGWGWLVVLAAFSCIFMTEGIVNSFGIIMLEIHANFGGTYATTAWIESLLIVFYFCSGN